MKTDIKKQKLLKMFEDIKERTSDLSSCWHIEEDELDDEERWQYEYTKERIFKRMENILKLMEQAAQKELSNESQQTTK